MLLSDSVHAACWQDGTVFESWRHEVQDAQEPLHAHDGQVVHIMQFTYLRVVRFCPPFSKMCYLYRVTEVEDEEYCLIPMGGVLPEVPQRILGNGGSAGMVHPSTGRPLQLSPPFSSAPLPSFFFVPQDFWIIIMHILCRLSSATSGAGCPVSWALGLKQVSLLCGPAV